MQVLGNLLAKCCHLHVTLPKYMLNIPNMTQSSSRHIVSRMHNYYTIAISFSIIFIWHNHYIQISTISFYIRL